MNADDSSKRPAKRPRKPRQASKAVAPSIAAADAAAAQVPAEAQDGLFVKARAHLYAVALGMTEKFRRRMEDPCYHPTPADLQAIFGAIRLVDEAGAGTSRHLARIQEIGGALTALKAELEAAETKLLGMLSGPTGKP